MCAAAGCLPPGAVAVDPSMAAGWDGTPDRLLDSFDLGRRVRGIRTGTRPYRANSPMVNRVLPSSAPDTV
ncbi:hypothetical protein Shyhy02_07390 [Streptomyces hygroscopicus subsp. hygroscopicus]|nr:hypothetical protein Shyhy02_07390 [Streptomyces hygroscopicus subsp. hygroscopicus]